MKSVEVVVIGAGIIGLSATDYLVKQNFKVACIEQSQPGSGQSAGYTRIYRQRHSESDNVYLAQEALRLWRQWEKEFGTELIIRSGQLTFGPNIAKEYQLCRELNIPCELLDKSDWQKLIPTHRDIDGPALFESTAGAIRADVIISSLANKHESGIIHDTVQDIDNSGQKIFVKSSKDVWECDRVIIAAGVNTPLLAKMVGIPIKVEKRLHTRLTFQSKQPQTLPCINDNSEQYGESAYGSAINESLYTVGLSNKVDNLMISKEEEITRNQARIRNYVKSSMPDFSPKEVAVRNCVMTYIEGPEDKFHIFERGNVKTIAGHNLFKFGPALGKLLAQDQLPA